jgi:hypothetical protein
MATSKSNEPRRKCRATASIFSGRRDPEWSVPEGTAHRLELLWRRLDAADESPGRAPALGYRGVTLVCGVDDSWFAYGGTVSRGGEHRRDPERQFERELLQSAPAGLIPDAVLRQFG